MTIEAKEEFHRATTNESREALQASLKSPVMRLALVFVLSKMTESGATAEQLRGAMDFRGLLLDLTEPKQTPTEYPVKQTKYH